MPEQQPSLNQLPFSRTEILLEENPSTGYLWKCVHDSTVTFKNLGFVCNTPAEIGTGGHRRFEITTPNPCCVIFEMRRPWESLDIAPIRKITVSIE